MRELDFIIAQYEYLKSENLGTVLATVVHVEGSSYRREGARMLIDEYGEITGAISGGCLEGDALQKALHALHQGKNKLITYDTSDENDAVIGAQLGCNGIIQVLFEPLDYRDQQNPCEILKLAVNQEQELAIITQFNLDTTKEQLGTIGILKRDLEITGKFQNTLATDFFREKSQIVFQNKNTHFFRLNIAGEIQQLLIEFYRPPIKLVIVGAGNDSQILARQAELLGWTVIITDGRPSHANKRRFAGSCQIIVTNPEHTLAHIEIDQRCYFALMSHNYSYDLAVLKLLLSEKNIRYIGILGPLKKYQRMQKDLETEGIKLTEAIKNKIHAPIGLEIGAETPAEIGLSILAEIQSVLTTTSARPLREKTVPIHWKISQLEKDNA